MRLLATLATLALLASPAAAQSGNPAGMTPGTPMAKPGKPAPYHTNNPDRLFIHLLTIGGNAEVSAGKLAESRARNGRVREFARMMVRDHAKANERLAELAKKARVPVPEGLDAEHRTQGARLGALGGAQFDLAYMRLQLVEHQKAVQLLQWEISAGQDAQLRLYASDTLPTVFQHLRMAQTIVAELTHTTPQGIAGSTAPPRPGARARTDHPHPTTPPRR